MKSIARSFRQKGTEKIPTEELVQMAVFVLKNNFFEFNGQIKQKMSRPAIGTICEVITYHPGLNNIDHIIIRNLQLLYGSRS